MTYEILTDNGLMSARGTFVGSMSIVVDLVKELSTLHLRAARARSKPRCAGGKG
jgi:hypothetical protein